MDEAGDLLGQPPGRIGDLGVYYLQLLLKVGIVDPVVEASPFQGVMYLPGTVGRDDHDGRMNGPEGAQLRDGYLKISQKFKQEAFKFLVGPVQLVDQQHRRPVPAFVYRLKQGALDQKPFAEQIVGGRLPVHVPGCFHQPDLQHLPGVVPFVDRMVYVQSFVALKADQLRVQPGGQGPGYLGLAHAGLTFQEKGPLQLDGQEYRHCQ